MSKSAYASSMLDSNAMDLPAAAAVVLSHPDVASRRAHPLPLNAEEADSSLIFLDLGRSSPHLTESVLAQVMNPAGNAAWPASDANVLSQLGAAISHLRAAGQLLAWHSKGRGGLLACVAEMAVAGQVGVSLNVDILLMEGDGITDSRADHGDAKNWAAQVSARRHELTLRALFSEEPGLVVQVRTAQRNDVMHTLRAHGLSQHSHFIGKTRPAHAALTDGKGELSVWRDTKKVLAIALHDVRQLCDAAR